jgi:hypothetical protein
MPQFHTAIYYYNMCHLIHLVRHELPATVSNCDWYNVQTISTGVSSGKLNGTFYVEYQGSRTIDMPADATAYELKN